MAQNKAAPACDGGGRWLEGGPRGAGPHFPTEDGKLGHQGRVGDSPCAASTARRYYLPAGRGCPSARCFGTGWLVLRLTEPGGGGGALPGHARRSDRLQASSTKERPEEWSRRRRRRRSHTTEQGGAWTLQGPASLQE